MLEFRDLPNGYSYKLLNDIDCDGQLCIAEIEIERYGAKTQNISEISRYTEELIEDIMKNYFQEKYKSFDIRGSLQQKGDNIYELNWTVRMKQDKFKYLKKYCEGCKITVLSGELTGKSGIFCVEQNGRIFKKVVEYIKTGQQKYNLRGVEFRFLEDTDQMTYEDIEYRKKQ
jgi:hypothetical protein